MARIPYPSDRSAYSVTGGLWHTLTASGPVLVYVDENPSGPAAAHTLADIRRIDGSSGALALDATGTIIDEWLSPTSAPASLIVTVDGGPPARVFPRLDAIAGGGVTGALLAANNLNDLANAATARGNLGLGSAAIHPAADFDTAGSAATAAAAAAAAQSTANSAATAASAAQTTANSAVAGLTGKQDADADLTAIAGLTPTNNDMLQRKSGAWTNRTLSQVKADLVLNLVDNTADVDKPVSSAAQTALDARPIVKVWNGSAYVAAPGAVIFVGGPTDPTVSNGDVWITT